MNSFHTKHTAKQFETVMHTLESVYGHCALYSRDCSKLIFDYTLYDEKKHTLTNACREGNLVVVKWLVEGGENSQDKKELAIRWASLNGHLEVVQFLVDQGADIHAREDSSIRWASTNGHLEVVRFLMAQGAPTDSALRCARRYRQLEVIEFLLSRSR